MKKNEIKLFPINTHKPLQQWVQNHPKLAENLVFEEKLKSVSSSTIYEKYTTQLTSFLSFVQKEKDDAIASLTDITSRPVMKVGSSCFEEMEKNMELRKICFAYQEKQRLEIKLMNFKFNLYSEKEEEAKTLINFFDNSKQLIPQECVCKMSSEYILFLPFPAEWGTISFQIDSLSRYLDRKNKEITSEALPLWATDFTSYYYSFVNDMLTKFDRSLCYMPITPNETYLEMSIFGGFCENLGIRAKIEEIVHNFEEYKNKLKKADDQNFTAKKGPYDKYIQYVLDEAIALPPPLPSDSNDFIPPKINLNNEDAEYLSVDHEQQSVGLLIFFRIIFYRLYSVYPNDLYENFSDLTQKIEEMSKLKISLFNLPSTLSKSFKNEDEPIRDVFRNDKSFITAVHYFEELSFIVNPIDQLYLVHKAILSINKAVLAHKIGESSQDSRPLYAYGCLSFDDLFVLLLGVLLASDFPEFASVALFLKHFSPSFCLSNSFEYAQAGIESLFIHIHSLNLNEFKDRNK